MRRGLRVVGLAAGTLLALSGCGAADDTSTDDRAAEAGSSRSPSVSHSSGASDSPKSQGGGDDPFTVTAGEWPRDLRGAKALFDKMPAKFKTWPVHHPRGEAGTAGVIYGSPNGEGAIAFAMEADEEVPDPRSGLSAMFGMGLSCDKATYRGTATPTEGGLGPGLGSGEGGEPWWFACQTEANDERSDPFVIGWTSGRVAWLVEAIGHDNTRELVDVMGARTS